MGVETNKYPANRKSEDHSQTAPVTVPLGGCMRYLSIQYNTRNLRCPEQLLHFKAFCSHKCSIAASREYFSSNFRKGKTQSDIFRHKDLLVFLNF